MRKLIETAIAYPLDCEVRLGSVMASLLASQEPGVSDGPAVCRNQSAANVGKPCIRCGKCRGWTVRERCYQALANEYAFVGGQAILQFDLSSKDPESRDELRMLMREGDYLDFMLGYAGYEHRSVEAAAGKEAVFAAVRESIDRGMPVLLQYQANQLWLLVTGYDTPGALYGYDGGSNADYYQKMTPAPDRYEGKLFQATNWHQAMARAVIVGRRRPPRVSLDDAIARNAALMKRIFDEDYYGRAAKYIRDDGNYRDEGDNLRRQAKLIDDFISLPIGGRSIVSWFLFDQLEREWRGCTGRSRADSVSSHRVWARELHTPRAEGLALAASCCCDIHEICWVAWRGVGRFEPQPERFHAKLADPLYRKLLAEVVLLVGMVDRHVYEALRSCAEGAPAA